MKTFVYDAIKERLIKRLKLNADAATVLDDSAFTNILDVVSEGFAENARYTEYLYLEKKWDTAKNISSLLSMGALIGRKRYRPESATGIIIVSHTDDDNNNRLANYGRYFFDLNEESDYDEIDKNEDADYIKKRALVPWLNSSLYTIPEGTEFVSNSGISFFATKSVKIKKLEKKYSEISSDEGTLKAFLARGGWDGIKYLKVPVIQGIKRKAQVGVSTGERNQAFKFEARNIEAGNNSISKKYFYIEVTEKDGTTTKWFELPMIQLAGPYDRVFETELSADGSYIIIKFGNGYSGRIPTKDSVIDLNYIETAGKSGNIEQNFQINTIKFPAGYSYIDPRTKNEREFLSCTNIAPISGGKDIESRDEFRKDAPSSYLKYYATSVKSNYEKKVYENSPYSLLNAKCFISSDFTAEQLDNSIDDEIEEEVLNQLSLISNSLNITAIKSNGQSMNEVESEFFINSLSESLAEIKGPNDALKYCAPLMIKMAPSILIKTSDLTVTDDAVINGVSQIIQSEFAVFQKDFKDDFVSSRIIHLASLFNFTDSVELTIDAIADVDYDNIELLCTEKDSIPLVSVPFKFSDIFSNDKFKKGFKNFKDGKKFNLRVDLRVKNGAPSSLERTLLLIDNREKLEAIKDAKRGVIDENGLASSLFQKIRSEKSDTEFFLYEENNSSYKNRRMRVAQFPILINNVLTNKFIDNLFSFENSPSEIRPFEQDNNGDNKILLSSIVDVNLQEPIKGNEIGTYCYRRNTEYINYFDISYNEEFNDIDNYANGFVLIPCDYINSLGTNNATLITTGLTLGQIQQRNEEYIKEIKRLLNDYLDIKVRAEPRADVITPLKWNEIVFVDDDDITVEKETVIKE